MSDEKMMFDKLGTITFRGNAYICSLISNEYSKNIIQLVRKIYSLKSKQKITINIDYSSVTHEIIVDIFLTSNKEDVIIKF